MADIKKYLGQEGTQELVNKIKSEDARVLQETKSYADSLGKNYDAAGAAATAEANAKAHADEKVQALADGQVKTNKEAIETLNGNKDVVGSVDAKVEAARAGLQANIDTVNAKAAENADAIAAINNETTGILAKAKADATEKTAAVQAEVDALETYVGPIPSSSSAKDVIGYINEKTSGIASDTVVAELSDRVTTVEGKVETLEKDHLVAADKAELEGKIAEAKEAADAAQTYGEGVAADLTKAKEDLTAADADAVARIESLEGQIVGLTGAMHFVGTKDAVPTEGLDTYANGDVIIVGNKEYVFNAGAFVELGDVTEEAQRISAVEGKVTTLEGEMDTAQADVAQLKTDVATKVAKSDYDAKVAELAGADTALAERLDTVESALGTGEGSVEDKIGTAKQEAITAATEAAAADATTKANAAEANAKKHADDLNTAMGARVEALEAIDHDHTNKAELDLVKTGDVAKWDAAAAKAHEHGNKEVLDSITAKKVAAWDASEKNAKDHADTLNAAMTTKVDAIDARVKTTEATLLTKADADDVEAIDVRLATAEAGVAANKAAIEAFTPISAADISAMFAATTV